MLFRLLATIFLAGGRVTSEWDFARSGPYMVRMCGGTNVALLCDVYGTSGSLSYMLALDTSNSTIFNRFKHEWLYQVKVSLNETHEKVSWIIGSHPELDGLRLVVHAFEEAENLQMIEESGNCSYELFHCSDDPSSRANMTEASCSKALCVWKLPYSVLCVWSMLLLSMTIT